MEHKRPLVLRLVEDYWGVLLLLIAWELWVIANRFNPIVMPTPTARSASPGSNCPWRCRRWFRACGSPGRPR